MTLDLPSVGAPDLHELIQLFNLSVDMLCVSNSEGYFLHINPAFNKSLGYTQHELLNKPVLTFIHPDDQEKTNRIIRQQLNKCETVVCFKIRYRHKNGTYRWLEWTSQHLVDQGVNYSVVRDVTEQEEMSAQLDQYRREVELLVQERTEVHEKDFALQQAVKMEAIGQLSGGIAHDFNNLLSILNANLEFLQEEINVKDIVIKQLFDDAFSAVNEGADLTRRMLSFARSNPSKTESREINSFLNDFSRILSRSLGPKIDLKVIPSTEDTCALVDPSQLKNAILNLAINARDAMPDGGELTIAVERRMINPARELHFPVPVRGEYVVISVADTGKGIDPQDLTHVFEPFFTTKKDGEGTGLGLSMVYGFAKQSGGACWIQSTPDVGTKVSLAFPAASTQFDQGGMVEESILPAGNNETILVVEDEPRILKTVKRQLRKLNYRVLGVENAELAMQEILSGTVVDLIFSDIQMPGKYDGYRLAEWVCEHYPEIEVVLTTGYYPEKSRSSVKNKLRFPLLRKPYSRDQLANQIRSVLDNRDD